MNTEKIIAEYDNNISQQDTKIAELDAKIEKLLQEKEQLASMARKLKAEAMLGENILNHIFVGVVDQNVVAFYSVASADARSITLIGVEFRFVKDNTDQKLVCPIAISVANRNDFYRQYKLADNQYLNQRRDLQPLFWAMQGLAACNYKMNYPVR